MSLRPDLAHQIAKLFYREGCGNSRSVHRSVGIGFNARHRADQRTADLVFGNDIARDNRLIELVLGRRQAEHCAIQRDGVPVPVEIRVARRIPRQPGMKPGADPHRLGETDIVVAAGAFTVGLLQMAETAELAIFTVVDAFAPDKTLRQTVAGDFIELLLFDHHRYRERQVRNRQAFAFE